jgi:hypothetical protein
MPYYGDVIPIAEYAGTRYEPSNGSEVSAFHDEWCCKCATDEEWCPILSASYRGEATQWVFSAEGWPVCTEFRAMDAPERDDKTIDMFGATEPASSRDSTV